MKELTCILDNHHNSVARLETARTGLPEWVEHSTTTTCSSKEDSEQMQPKRTITSK